MTEIQEKKSLVAHEIQISVSVNKVLVEHSHAHFYKRLCMDDFVTVEEIQSSKTFTICSLKRKLACP
jgi:hypothetical protein